MPASADAVILPVFEVPGTRQAMISIRRFEERDWPATWKILETVFRAGETYPCSTAISEEEAYDYWIEQPSVTYIATDNDIYVEGSYYIKPNQPGLGGHVCNCGYVVGENARGRGIASEMCTHSQHEAVAQGFRAMQYNLVVSTNESAVHLWKKQGFDIIGTLPGAFQHRRLGFVDAHVMYKQLVTP
jgi:ribosomal protein S18 acetylase RimI-like enzyme